MMCNCKFPTIRIKKPETNTSGKNNPIYMRWHNMLHRCYGESKKNFLYKAFGILVCEQWHSFENYLKFENEFKKGLSLDRVNGSWGYCPHNAKWSTPKEQQLNRFKFERCSNVHKGVYWRRDKNKYHAQLSVDGFKIHIGYFNDPDIAYEEYKIAYQEWYGKTPPERSV